MKSGEGRSGFSVLTKVTPSGGIPIVRNAAEKTENCETWGTRTVIG